MVVDDSLISPNYHASGQTYSMIVIDYHEDFEQAQNEW